MNPRHAPRRGAEYNKEGRRFAVEGVSTGAAGVVRVRYANGDRDTMRYVEFVSARKNGLITPAEDRRKVSA